MFNKYPYTDFHELNLDWILKKIKELAKELEDFEILNTIRYEGVWDITKNYQPWNIVDYNNVAYIATKLVPAGVEITNTDYWAIIADYSVLFDGRNYLNGKKVVVYGDSTVAPSGGFSYMDIVAQVCNCEVTNRAVPGTTMAIGPNNGVGLVTAATDLGDFDYIFLCYGTNEWQGNLSPQYLRSSVNDLLNAVYSNSDNIEIVFVNPYYSYKVFGTNPANVNNAGMTLEECNSIIQKELDANDVRFIDFYHRSGCSKNNYTKLLANDSGGTYVHPTDLFKRELAAVVAEGANSQAHDKYITPMLFDFDFRPAQNNISTATYSYLLGAGLCVSSGIGTIKSTPKQVDVSQYSEYILRGFADRPFQATFNGITVDVVSDEFCIKFPKFSVAGQSTLDLTFTTSTNVYNLQMYHVSSFPNDTGDVSNYGRSSLFTYGTNVAAYNSFDPKYAFSKDGIIIGGGMINVTANLGGLANVLVASTDVSFPPDWMIILSSAGTPAVLQLSDNRILAPNGLVAGVYYVPSKVLKYALNPYVTL